MPLGTLTPSCCASQDSEPYPHNETQWSSLWSAWKPLPNQPVWPFVLFQAVSIWSAATPSLTGPTEMALRSVAALVQSTDRCGPSL